MTVIYTYRSSLSGIPNAGELLFDRSIQNQTSTIFCSGQDANLISSTGFWDDTLAPALVNYLTVTKVGDSSKWLKFRITRRTSPASAHSYQVSMIGSSSASPFSDSDQVQISYVDLTGYSGFSGYSGYSGYSGSGVSGYSGYSGANPGASGYSGFSGYSGKSGFSGYSGFSGFSGSGVSGYSGFSGFSGFSGSGVSGYSGYSGSGAWDSVFTVTGSNATTTGQALVDITGLVSGTLNANKIYEFEATLAVLTTAVTTGTKYGVKYTGTVTSIYHIAMGPATVASNLQVGNVGGANASSVGGATFLTTASEDGVVYLRGWLSAGATPGVLSIQHLKVTSGTSTVKVGSTFKIRQIN